MSLWNELIKLRDSQIAEWAQSKKVVSFEDLPWEVNPEGKMRWYLSPVLHPKSFNTGIIYVLEIPPGSRSGKMLRQGGWALYIWAGRGYSIVNDQRYDWEEDDMFLLPVTAQGNVFQHFNTDPANPARILAFAPNLTDCLGVEGGVGFEALEPCPEYQAGGGTS